MPDKFRATFPIEVTFSDGELPSAAKMNGVSQQAQRGLSLVEYALGDIWNQAGDSLIGTVPDAALMIPNIGRYLGSPKHTNPRIPYLSGIEKYTHLFNDYAGAYDARLPFPPAAGSSWTWTGTTRDASPVASKSLLAATGDWFIDTDTGDVFVYDVFATGDKLEYAPDVQGDLGDGYTWNIIPDPDTDDSYNFRGLKVAYKNGVDNTEGYYIYLPPRMPLDTRRVEQSPQDSAHAPAHSDNFQSSPASGDKLFWQSSSADADTSANAEHYRYTLPPLITENWGQSVTLPTGMLYLWDPTGSGTIITGLTFSAEDAGTPRKWVLVVTGDAMETWLSTTQGQAAYPAANLSTYATDHAPAYYPNTGLRLITVGAGVSGVLSTLMAQFLNHDHSTASSMLGRRVDHQKLANLFRTEQGLPNIVPTGWDYDDHSQYIHRYGAGQISGNNRDVYRGAMLGNLGFASTNSFSNYLNIVADSYSIWFGNPTAGAEIKGTTGGGLDITSGSAGDIRIDCGLDTERIELSAGTGTFIVSDNGEAAPDKVLAVKGNPRGIIDNMQGESMTDGDAISFGLAGNDSSLVGMKVKRIYTATKQDEIHFGNIRPTDTSAMTLKLLGDDGGAGTRGLYLNADYAGYYVKEKSVWYSPQYVAMGDASVSGQLGGYAETSWHLSSGPVLITPYVRTAWFCKNNDESAYKWLTVIINDFPHNCTLTGIEPYLYLTQDSGVLAAGIGYELWRHRRNQGAGCSASKIVDSSLNAGSYELTSIGGAPTAFTVTTADSDVWSTGTTWTLARDTDTLVFQIRPARTQNMSDYFYSYFIDVKLQITMRNICPYDIHADG
jgi:hypothetical protein